MKIRPFDRCWTTPLADEIKRINTLREEAGMQVEGSIARVRAADAQHHNLSGFLDDVEQLILTGAVSFLPPITFDGTENEGYRVLATEVYAGVFMPLDDQTVLALLFTDKPAFVAEHTVWAASLYLGSMRQ